MAKLQLDLNKILEEIKKASNETSVRTVKVDEKEVFDKNEQGLFITTRIKSLDDAKKVAELLAKIKVAKEKKQKDDDLLDTLEKERDDNNFRGSLAYRILNVNNLVRNATDYLTFLSTGVPKSKEDRKKKADQLEKEINEKRAELSLNNTSLIPLENKYKAALEDETEAKTNLERRESIYEVISGDPASDFEITRQGSRKKISDASFNVNITDYSGNALWDESARAKTSISLQVALQRADGFLNSITSNYRGKNLGASFKWVKANGNYFNGRVYQSKESLTSIYANIGRGLIRELRNFGPDKLKAIVADSGVTGDKKTRLEKYAEEMLWTNHTEAIAGDKNYVQGRDQGEKWTSRYDRWHKTLLTKKTNEYPYVPAVDWERLFDFMTSVFPLKDNSDTTKGVQDKDYLVKKGSDNFLGPEDEAKGWEGKITVQGFSTKGTDGKGMSWLSRQPNSDPRIPGEVANPNKIPSDWTFKSIIELWYDSFAPFVDFTTNKWKDSSIDTYGAESLENKRCQLRYCLTMQEILKELGFAKHIHDFDEYLLEIADRAGKKIFQTDRENLVKNNSSAGVLQMNIKKEIQDTELVLKAISEGKVWNIDYTQSRTLVLRNLIDSSRGDVTLFKGKADALKTQVGEIEKKNAEIIFEINKKKQQLTDLKDVDNFEDAPVPDKKKLFEDLYNKKSTQNNKWLLTDIKKMSEEYLPRLKKAMNDDNAYKSEGFEDKETELKKIIEKVVPILGKIGYSWGEFQNQAKDQVASETIKLILKSKEDESSGKAELELILGLFNELGNEVILTDKQEHIKKELIEAIADPSKFKDIPQNPEISESELKTFFGGIEEVVNQELADKWKNSGVQKDKIKGIIEKVTKSDKRDQATEKFIEHLKKGLDNEEKLTEKDDAEKIWKEFLGKDPERVVRTIYTHKLEETDFNDNTKTEMKAEKKGSGDDEEKLDMSKYGASEKDGDPSDKGMVDYLWEKAKGGSGLLFYKVKGEKDENGGGPKENTSWFKFGGGNYRPFITYGLGLVVTIGAGMAIFWKNISDWWNGPAEEEGAGTEESGKEEDEEK